MNKSFKITIPRLDTSPLIHTIAPGQTMFVVGANGAGKSALISKIAHEHYASCRRLAAHRPNWFSSNVAELTPKSCEDYRGHIRNFERSPDARWKSEYAQQRISIAFYDFINATHALNERVATLMRDGQVDEAQKIANQPTPISVINSLMRLAHIPIKLVLQNGSAVTAQKEGSSPYSVAELSDGERNAFLLAAEILTAPKGTLFLLDEPERHLHRSIISPLLNTLFSTRDDCAFIIATHEIQLPLDTPEATVMIVYNCYFDGNKMPSHWDINLLTPSDPLPVSLKKDVLGSRSKILFVEGDNTSLDFSLYAVLFPGTTVIPKGNCRDVMQATRGMRSASECHWITAVGLIDEDFRSQKNKEELALEGIISLPCYSVESLYYHVDILRLVAHKMTMSPSETLDKAIAKGIQKIMSSKEYFTHFVAKKTVEQLFHTRLPTAKRLEAKILTFDSIDVPSLLSQEETIFEDLCSSLKLPEILERYPVRESSLLNTLAIELGFCGRKSYEMFVQNMMREDDEALSILQNLLEPVLVALNSDIPKDTTSSSMVGNSS